MTDGANAPTSTDHDAALLVRVRAGESAALDELLGRALGIARRYSSAVCGRAPDREDAVQEALLQTFRHAHGIREPRAFRAWLYRAVKNACLIGRRRTGSDRGISSLDAEGSLEAVDPSRTADDQLLAAEDRERVRLALAALPASYREAIFLREFEGLSTREVARVVGITEANVKVRLHRAHAQLRRRLEASKPA
jgi:RNA polymerase sigma-70 factor (ECF subfamily)